MTGPSPHEDAPARRPLRTVFLILATVLLLPTLLFYAVAPDEPFKEHVAVFAKGRTRAYFAEPLRYRAQGYDRFCVLEADAPLVILQQASDRSDGSLLTLTQGEAKPELPFCPAGAAVSLRPHQVRQKEDVLGRIRTRLAQLFAP
jgi:hypothetical protein